MFEQFIGTGGNVFIAIVVVILGFVAALGYVDSIKTKKENKDRIPFKD